MYKREQAQNEEEICCENLLGEDNHPTLISIGNVAIIFIDIVVGCSSSPTSGLVYLCLKLIAATATE